MLEPPVPDAALPVAAKIAKVTPEAAAERAKATWVLDEEKAPAG